MTEKDILNNIRKERFKNVLLSFCAILVTGSIACGLFNQMKTDGFHWVTLIVAVWSSMACFCALIALLYDAMLIIKPKTSNIITRYGDLNNLSKILETIYNDVVYQDDNIVISSEYILNKKWISNLVAINDILWIYEKTTKYNGIITKDKKIVVRDAHGDEREYKYSDTLFSLFSKICINAKVGYTIDNERYYKEMLTLINQKLPAEKQQKHIHEVESLFKDDVNEGSKSESEESMKIDERRNKNVKYSLESIEENVFYCPNCHKQVDAGDNFCKNCARKLNWKQKIELE